MYILYVNRGLGLGVLPVKIDDEDYDLVKDFTWIVSSLHAPYVKTMKEGKNLYLHHLVMGITEPNSLTPVHHIDEDTYNCQKSNLVVVTASRNRQGVTTTKKSKKPSKYFGVYWSNQKRKWHAEIRLQGHKYHGGFFRYEENAAKSYNKLAILFYGSNAKLNRIGGI